jgi:hypothetical protein
MPEIKTMIVKARQILTLLTMLLVSNLAYSHALGQSYVFLTINDTSIDGRLEINIPDLNRALSLNLATDKSVKPEDIQPHLPAIKQYYLQHVSINLGEGLVLKDFFLHAIPKAQYLAFNFSFKNLADVPEFIDFEYSVLFDIEPNHRGFVVIENDWRSGTFDDEGNVALIFTPDDTKRRLDLTESTVMQGYIEMFKLGIHHIWEGIDHILFLLALLLPAVVHRFKKEWVPTEKFYPSFIYVVKIVTVFTLAHTITLSAATLGLVNLPSRLVESIIALSIAIAALDIIYPIFRGRIWLVVFVFGLFHGFGFASVLSNYAIPESYLTLSLLSFNLGVEAGQVAIVAVLFPILFLLRNSWVYPKLFLKSAAAVLIIVSLYWFIERGFEIDLPAGAAMNWVLDLLGLR